MRIFAVVFAALFASPVLALAAPSITDVGVVSTGDGVRASWRTATEPLSADSWVEINTASDGSTSGAWLKVASAPTSLGVQSVDFDASSLVADGSHAVRLVARTLTSDQVLAANRSAVVDTAGGSSTMNSMSVLFRLRTSLACIASVVFAASMVGCAEDSFFNENYQEPIQVGPCAMRNNAVCRNMDLTGLTLSPSMAYIDARGTDFTRTRRDRDGLCDLVGADLRDAVFDNATLPGCDIYSAKLQGVRAYRANFAGADFTYSDLRGADFREARLVRAEFAEPVEDGADLRGTDFRGADLRRAHFRGARIDRSTRFENARVEGASGLPEWAIAQAVDG